MGKSKTVEKTLQTNADFKRMMDQLTIDVETDSKKYFDEFERDVEQYYSISGYDKKILESGKHLDYQLENELSFDNINKVIANISKELFHCSSGDEADKDKKEIGTALLSYEEMAVNIAIALLTSSLSALANKQVVEYQYNIDHTSVCPGVTLHLCIVNKSYQGSSFFKNTTILQNYIYYKIGFSREKAGAEADISYLNQLMTRMEKSSQSYDDMQDRYDNLLISDDYIMEDEDGPKHHLAVSLERVMTNLENSRSRAYESIQKIRAAQENVIPNTRSISLTAGKAPNAALLAFLKEE